MSCYQWMTAKEVLRVNAIKWPNKVAIKDLYKSYTFKQLDGRACRLANALTGWREEGRSLAALAPTASSGWRPMRLRQKAASLSFLSCSGFLPEMEYNINHSECKVFSSRAARTPETARNIRGSRWS
jgi:acyl-CoA synthetase (AMP-forming)/AMP-acid ligase II